MPSLGAGLSENQAVPKVLLKRGQERHAIVNPTRPSTATPSLGAGCARSAAR